MEVFVTHATSDAYYVARSFKSGSWAPSYWGGLLLGTILPVAFVVNIMAIQLLSIASLIVGLYILMRAWIYAPQDMHLV